MIIYYRQKLRLQCCFFYLFQMLLFLAQIEIFGNQKTPQYYFILNLFLAKVWVVKQMTSYHQQDQPIMLSRKS